MNRIDKEEFSEGDTLPPNDVGAERALLGAFLIDPEIVDSYSPKLEPDDFYFDANRRIFAALAELQNEGIGADIVVLLDKLRNNGELDAVGGEAAIAEIMGACHTTLNADRYAAIIAEKSLRRKLISEAAGIRSEAQQGESPAPLQISRRLQSLERLSESVPRKTLFDAGSLVTETLSLLDRSDEAPISTGYDSVDNMLNGGFRPKNLVVIAARPRGGKTAAAVNLVQNTCLGNRVPTAFFSLEMTASEIAFRIISHESRVFSAKLTPGAAIRGQLASYDIARIAEAGERLKKSPFWIEEKSGASLSEIVSSMRMLHRKHGVRMFFVDYAGIVDAELPDRPIREQITRVAVTFKAVAKDLGVVVVLLAQLNRESASVSGGKLDRDKLINMRPKLEHLKESGALEENADVAILLHRPELLVSRNEAATMGLEGCAEWILAKNRNGRQGELSMRFNGRFVRFEEDTACHAEDRDCFSEPSDAVEWDADGTGTEEHQQKTFNDGVDFAT